MTYDFKTIDIKGKPYVSVNERIKYFWSKYPAPQGRITTIMKNHAEGVVLFETQIFIDDKLVATGNAQEKETSSFINKTSYIENCETSSVGRALGILGIGIDTSIATAEEVEIAIAGQENVQEIDVYDLVISAMKSKFKTIEDKRKWFESKGIKTAVKEMKDDQLKTLLDLLNELS